MQRIQPGKTFPKFQISNYFLFCPDSYVRTNILCHVVSLKDAICGHCDITNHATWDIPHADVITWAWIYHPLLLANQNDHWLIKKLHECLGVSNHGLPYCPFNSLPGITTEFCITDSLWKASTSGFPSTKASDAKKGFPNHNINLEHGLQFVPTTNFTNIYRNYSTTAVINFLQCHWMTSVSKSHGWGRL